MPHEADTERHQAALAIVRRATARLAALSGDSASGDGLGLGAVAEQLYSDRRRRDEQFPPGLFGEPAWDLLLALFAAHEEGRDLDLPAAYAAARVGPDDGPAVIDRLVAAGMVERGRARHDKRRHSVLLTEEAIKRLGDYLADT